MYFSQNKSLENLLIIFKNLPIIKKIAPKEPD